MNSQIRTAIVYPSYAAFRGRSGFEGTWINHGIASIIAYAKGKGEKVDLIDLRTLRSWQDFDEAIGSYDLVGYSILTQDKEIAAKAIKRNRIINPVAKICVGGVHASLCKEEYLHDNDINYIITGEGEKTFFTLMESLNSYRLFNRLTEGEKIDLDEIPHINRLEWERENPVVFNGLNGPFFTLISSRSCRYNCNFCQPCSRIMFGKRERIRSPRHVVGELQALKLMHGMNSFFLIDDNIFQNRQWMLDFIDLYNASSIDAKFVLSGRSNNICDNSDILPHLKCLGLEYVIVGFESGSQRILNYLRKGTTVSQNYRAAELLHNADIKVFADIMFGFQGETTTDIRLTRKFVIDIKPEIFSPTTFTPYPGNALSDKYMKEQLTVSSLGNPIRHADRPKIKGARYIYINLTLLWIQLSLATNSTRKLLLFVKYYFLNLKTLWFYFLNFLVEAKR